MSARGDIEDAVIALIETLGQDQDAGYLTSVQPYNGSPSPDDEDPAFNRLLQNGTPVVGVMTGDIEYEDVALEHTLARGEMPIQVLVVSGNPRSHEAHLRGDSVDDDPGLYQMEEDIRDAVWGVSLGVTNASPADPIRTTNVLRGERFTAWLITFMIRLHVEAIAEDADADDYTTVRTNINNDPDEDDAADPIVTGDIDL